MVHRYNTKIQTIDKQYKYEDECVCVRACVRVCVSERECERERETRKKQSEREIERVALKSAFVFYIKLK